MVESEVGAQTVLMRAISGICGHYNLVHPGRSRVGSNRLLSGIDPFGGLGEKRHIGNITKAFLLWSIAVLLLSLPWPYAAAPGPTIVTAAQVNGTWHSKNGSFKVWALGNQKLRVEFSGIYEYNTPAGPMANTGRGGGIAFIEGNTAIFKPEGTDDECKITMKFERAKLLVKQEGSCGFGLNVTADGTYRKVSQRKPTFD